MVVDAGNVVVDGAELHNGLIPQTKQQQQRFSEGRGSYRIHDREE